MAVSLRRLRIWPLDRIAAALSLQQPSSRRNGTAVQSRRQLAHCTFHSANEAPVKKSPTGQPAHQRSLRSRAFRALMEGSLAIETRRNKAAMSDREGNTPAHVIPPSYRSAPRTVSAPNTLAIS
jgi:hypothetical protein